MFDMMREAAAKRPGVITKVGLDTFVDPDHGGLRHECQGGGGTHRAARSNSKARSGSISPPSSRTSRSSAPASCDERGNLSFEQEGAYLGAMELALAAHNNGGIVIAQVRAVVRERDR